MVIQGHLIQSKMIGERSIRIGHIPHAVKTRIQRNESQTIFCVIDEKFGVKICCTRANLNLVPHHFLLSKIGPFCCSFFHSSLRNRFGIESCQVSFIFSVIFKHSITHLELFMGTKSWIWILSKWYWLLWLG